MSEQLTVQLTRAATHAVITVSGEIDLASAPVLRAAIDTLIDSGSSQLIVDLEHALFMDSCALNTLISAVKRLGSDSLGVVATRPLIRRVFTISGTDQVITIFDSLAAAVEAAAPDEDTD